MSYVSKTLTKLAKGITIDLLICITSCYSAIFLSRILGINDFDIRSERGEAENSDNSPNVSQGSVPRRAIVVAVTYQLTLLQ